MAASETVQVTSMAAGGDGLARLHDGQLVFIPGAVEGDLVRITVARGRDFSRGRLESVERPSADRVQPPCPAVAAGCGGCGWQHIRPEAQVRLKRSIVVDALRRIGKIGDPEGLVRADGALPDRGYRTTVRVHTDAEGRPGFRASASHDVVPIPPAGCLVAHPSLRDRLAGSYAPLVELQLRASVATGEVSVSAAATEGGTIIEEVAGHRFRISPDSFFQARPDGAARLVALAESALFGPVDRDCTLIDLYGGVGLFAATIGRLARRVILVERSSVAASDAVANLEPLRTAGTAVKVVCENVDDWRPEEHDLVSGVAIVADPARAGLGRRGVDTIAKCHPSRLVLVSCDAASLGRDARMLLDAGFELMLSTVVDMFPHTPHVEVVSVFDPVLRRRW